MFCKFQRLAIAGIGLAALVGVATSGAEAAPQALALVATNGDVTFKCEGGICGAEMSAFCLQPDRITPTKGTKYSLIQGSDLKLTGRTRDGQDIDLDGGKILQFETARTHVALRVSIAREALDALGVDEVRISVGENVALLPVPVAGDDNPQDEGDVAIVTGSLRRLGARIIDQNRKHMVAARLTSRMINDLPTDGWVAAEKQDRIWQSLLSATAGRSLPKDAVGLAHRAVEFCNFAVTSNIYRGMQSCLQSEHDDFLKILNSRYYSAVKTGS
ncbi:MAG: hypothetical protein QF893_24485 [Alphaproteobacteria bacterium]|jgi:hypothetical protein|nr:hypothetical protein [Alphaproteobacteria bacterium]